MNIFTHLKKKVSEREWKRRKVGKNNLNQTFDEEFDEWSEDQDGMFDNKATEDSCKSDNDTDTFEDDCDTDND